MNAPDTINGLPAHPLIVHATVVLVPLAALAVILHAVWPAARRRLGVLTPVLGVVALILTWVTIGAGEALARDLGPAGTSPAVQRHEHFAEQLPPWAIALAVISVGEWLWFRYDVPARISRHTARRGSDLAVRAVSCVVAVGMTVMLVRAGDAGARATWGGVG
ncbi:hypothetical protein HJ588_05040 [Flexivirga sp. ID2601S]|uniref:DUF2231 domain-containing protein n=1 Tax=Flexivirga aerilata TaxID=1656889 RepID=A0A849APD5_9MICO|nr:DUF2231 domain-containing protein [Flexivirga aerilata]NNG38642.1 hypothetical protein [Flexivirga aerilata]